MKQKNLNLLILINSINRFIKLSDSELIFVDTFLANERKITVGAFYRPPNADTKPLLDM